MSDCGFRHSVFPDKKYYFRYFIFGLILFLSEYVHNNHVYFDTKIAFYTVNFPTSKN